MIEIRLRPRPPHPINPMRIRSLGGAAEVRLGISVMALALFSKSRRLIAADMGSIVLG